MVEVSFSFIIPTFNSEKTIGKCLSSIPRRKDTEVIVVDNFSSDSTVNICKRHGAKVYQIKSTIAKARNYGANRSSGEYVVRLDSDEAVSEPFFYELIEALEEHEPDIAWASRVGVGYWQKVITAINDAHCNYFYGRPYKPKISIAYRKELFLRFSQDEMLHWYEDEEQMERMSPDIRTTVTLKNSVFHLPVRLKDIAQKRIRLHKLSPSQAQRARLCRPKRDAKSYAYRYLYVLRQHPLQFPGAILLAGISTFLRLIRGLRMLSVGV